jgi:hypothetical protein
MCSPNFGPNIENKFSNRSRFLTRLKKGGFGMTSSLLGAV